MSIAVQPRFVGIDVSKSDLVVAVHGDDKIRTFTNCPKGIARLRAWLRRSDRPVAVAFEATGGYEWPVWEALDSDGIAARQVSPAEVKSFGAASGVPAKTDALDARTIAAFQAFRPGAGRVLERKNIRTLRELVTARRQRVAERSRLVQQVDRRAKSPVADLDAQLLAALKEQIAVLDRRIQAALEADPDLRRANRLLRSIPGIGPVVAATILAELPEIGCLTAKTAGAIAGLAPIARDSGKFKGKRFISGGRRPLRDALYMAATVAARHHPDLSKKFASLTQRGLPYKKAITAIARKLANEANAILKRGTPWENRTG